MMTRREIATVAFVVFGGASVGEAAFERAPTSAREAALGGGRASAVTGAFANPARIGAEGGAFAAGASFGRPFGVPDLREEQAFAVWAGAAHAVAFGYRSFGYRSLVYPASERGSAASAFGSYVEREFRLVGRRRLPGRAAVGVAVWGMAVVGPGFSARRTAAVDVGFTVRTDELRWAAQLEAVVGELPGDPDAAGAHAAIAVERVLRFGRIVAEVGKAGDRDDSYVVLGGAWQALPILTLRAGTHSARATWAVGAGLQIFPATVDVAYEAGHPLGATVRLGLRCSGGGADGGEPPPE